MPVCFARLLIATKQREACEDVLDARQLATKQDLQLEIKKVRGEAEKVRAEFTCVSHQQLKWFLGFGIACAALLARAYNLFGV